jgi:hypothetical protein
MVEEKQMVDERGRSPQLLSRLELLKNSGLGFGAYKSFEFG